MERPPVSSWLPPLAACALLGATLAGFLPGHSTWVLVPAVLLLIGTVFAAVHHAEVIALKLGEPFGTLVLALAVTLIEGSLIVSLMLAAGDDAATLARDTVFATVMIVCNGVIGLCLLAGSVRHHVVSFRPEGTIPAVAVLATLATLTLVLPQFTLASVGPTYSTAQLVFAGFCRCCSTWCSYSSRPSVTATIFYLTVATSRTSMLRGRAAVPPC